MAKRIFISDIHMGDSRGIAPGGHFFPYCWFHAGSSPGSNRPEMLHHFVVDCCLNDQTVNEVVVLGDLFDEWNCPTDFDPTDPGHPIPPRNQQIKNIAHADQNRPVVDALSQLAAQGRLKYVQGNHDMLADKAVMGEIFPGIDYLESADGHAVYRQDGIWAEHGHWYGLFNAPYKGGTGDGFNGSCLPLGFFVSRISASATLTTGEEASTRRVLANWVEHIIANVQGAKEGTVERGIMDSALMGLFRTLISTYGQGQRGTVMNGLDGVPGLVAWQQIVNRYDGMCNRWNPAHAEGVGPFEALVCDAADLDQAAMHVVFNHTAEARIVLFGHTHKADIGSNLCVDEIPGQPPPETRNIYVNSGAWNNDTPTCTFVETELDSVNKRHFVRLKSWVEQPNGTYGAEDYGPDLYIQVS